jgi:hypothetical protein
MLSYDESRLDDYLEDPYKQMPHEVLVELGRDIDAVPIDGAFYFHGTCAVAPEGFRREGILPLDHMTERIWATLYELVSNECAFIEWTDFRRTVETDASGHDGYLYRLKTGDRLHLGPYGLLVREIFFDPSATGSHDYLGCPEIVQDIGRCYRRASGIDLERRFCEASRAVIVKFRSTEVWEGRLCTALWYVYTKLRDDQQARLPHTTRGAHHMGRCDRTTTKTRGLNRQRGEGAVHATQILLLDRPAMRIFSFDRRGQRAGRWRDQAGGERWRQGRGWPTWLRRAAPSTASRLRVASGSRNWVRRREA